MSISKTIGIAGGMGPKAGLLLFDYIMKHTSATCDQEHLPIILMSFPHKIQDRTAFLEGEVEQNPGYAIGTLINKLAIAGAEVIGIPCNTSHTSRIFKVIEEQYLEANVKASVLHMPLEVIKYLEEEYQNCSRIGVLTTNGTYRSRMYESYLENAGFIPVIPDADFQYEIVHQLIYNTDFGLKANTEKITEKAAEYIQKINTYFKEKNVELVIFGCTELSMLNNVHFTIPYIDSTEILAKALIREATY